jgi:hypothetical protein
MSYHPFISRFFQHKLSVLSGIFFTLLTLLAAFSAQGQENSSEALWQYYPPLKISTATATNDSANRPSRPQQTRTAAKEADDDAMVENDSPYGGFSSHLDPLFDLETRPSLTPPRIDKPMIERPTYDVPSYDAPMYRTEQVNKPVVDRPIYDAPFVNRPNYSEQYTEGPAEIAPTLATPDYRRPDYVVKPYEPPAVNAPTVDHSGINYHPEEYKAPVYKPDEYHPPRELPPEYMPPEE